MPFPVEAKGQGQSKPSSSSPICKALSSCGFSGSVLGDPWPPMNPGRGQGLKNDQGKDGAVTAKWQLDVSKGHCPSSPYPPPPTQHRELATGGNSNKSLILEPDAASLPMRTNHQ